MEKLKEVLNLLYQHTDPDFMGVSKGEILKAMELDYEFDTATPAHWAHICRGMGINPEWYIISYQETTNPKPVHILELIFAQIENREKVSELIFQIYSNLCE